MPVVVIATPKAANANSYATLAEGNTYHDAHPYPGAWDDGSDDEKNRALVTATRMLDTWFEWFGDQTTLTQALRWPRRGVLKPGLSYGSQPASVNNSWHEPFGVVLDPDTIPVIIREATAELARNLLTADRTADSDIETQGIEHLKAGPIELTFKGGVPAKPIPDMVMAMCTQVGRLRPKSGEGGVTLYRA